MTNKNGYVIEMLADSQLFGPYATYNDALIAFNVVMGYTAKDNPARIRAIESAPEAVIVDDCGRSECRHCRSMEKDAREAIQGKV